MEPTKQRVTQKELDLCQRVIAAVDFYEVRMIAQEARLQKWNKTPKMMGVGHGSETRRDADRGRIVVEATFTFEMAEDTDESRNDPPVAIRAVFALAYKVENLDSFSDEELQAFGDINGVLNAWPFWRELVYSTLSRMGMPPITLPTFRVVPSEEKATEKTSA